MRFAERFLVAFAVIALVMRYAGLKDGPTMELIALPLLAAFYLLAMPLFLFRQRAPFPVIGSIAAGAGLAYCIVSLLLYTLGWLPRADMLENCCAILVLITGGCGIAIQRTQDAGVRQLFWRGILLLSAILIVAIIPMPGIGRH